MGREEELESETEEDINESEWEVLEEDTEDDVSQSNQDSSDTGDEGDDLPTNLKKRKMKLNRKRSTAKLKAENFKWSDKGKFTPVWYNVFRPIATLFNVQQPDIR